MNKPYSYPDFATIESHIQRARLERAVALSQMLAAGVDAAMRGLRAVKTSLEANFHAVMHRTISSDALARRSVPRY
jgi:hypothetical protein